MRENRTFQFIVQDRIRGKVAEVLFEEMFKSAGYIVMFNGYERNLEYLVQTRGVFKCDEKLKTFGSAPDFLLVGIRNYYFVEVKYRTYVNEAQQLEMAKRIEKYYPHARIFLVTPEEPYFYYNSVERIIANEGRMEVLCPGEVGISLSNFVSVKGALRWILKGSGRN